MRRYLPVLLMACFIAVSVIVWSYYLAGYAGDKSGEKMKAITVYTALSVEPVAVLAQEYERLTKVTVHVIPLSETELLAKLQEEASAPRGDIILGGTALLKKAGRQELLAAYTSEALDMIPERFQGAANLWTGIWYDPVVWAVNQDYLLHRKTPPSRWTDLTAAVPLIAGPEGSAAAKTAESVDAATKNTVLNDNDQNDNDQNDQNDARPIELEKKQKMGELVTVAFLPPVVAGPQPMTVSTPPKDNQKLRLAMTDFLAADAAADLLYAFVSVNGEEKTLAYLKKMHPLVVQYAKFLATPVRMAGMGEADIAIAVQSEAIRYLRNGFPIKIVYPEEGTAALITAAGLVKNSPNAENAKLFLEWLTQDAAHATLQKSGYFYVPTNPEITTYRDIADQRLRLLTAEKELSPEQRREVLDRWVQTVRLEMK
ncbi:MAG TPA: extracellular solute-binding protein [Patescibacteria group bacterium]|nr:extracellular solute-binding protein [Patescibacteria group bacterium]